MLYIGILEGKVISWYQKLDGKIMKRCNYRINNKTQD